ncbi:16S rRNA pseudouridine(516) synthase RsuA [Marinobacter fonticola]|uniref:16S rRNA pseudouridine(516) synthase RsuA n=1 Tax=Marinobacter fonticola TaxID=2603215 RepID=UPI0011E63CE9|nr:16S rRNA pseudouridine(516) synthase RsuA [Marinobacter fonticola]
MRLDYFIANSANVSRKEARRLILAARASVDGVICKKAATQLSGSERVTLDDESMVLPGERYLMLHKPEGVVSATTDSEHPTALDLLPPDWRRNLHIAGRLDKDTTGLLLLSTDGQWTHRVTSPRAECPKTYLATLAEPLPDDALSQLEKGVELRGETKLTAPATVERLNEDRLRLTISEGRYHQVKRMLAAVGNRVVALHRERIGAVSLDPELVSGNYRELSQAEIDSF